MTADNERTIASYLVSLGSGAPTPGGGSAAAYTGSMGVALVGMVANLTRPGDDASLAEVLTALARLATTLTAQLAECAVVDEGVYAAYREAASLPKGTEADKTVRKDAIQHALLKAAVAPIMTARHAVVGLRLAEECAAVGTKHALSDLRIAQHLLNACIAGAFENVQVNIEMLTDAASVERLIGDVQTIQAESGDANRALSQALAARTS